jgi:hypothetical protein
MERERVLPARTDVVRAEGARPSTTNADDTANEVNFVRVTLIPIRDAEMSCSLMAMKARPVRVRITLVMKSTDSHGQGKDDPVPAEVAP